MKTAWRLFEKGLLAIEFFLEESRCRGRSTSYDHRGCWADHLAGITPRLDTLHGHFHRRARPLGGAASRAFDHATCGEPEFYRQGLSRNNHFLDSRSGQLERMANLALEHFLTVFDEFSRGFSLLLCRILH